MKCPGPLLTLVSHTVSSSRRGAPRRGTEDVRGSLGSDKLAVDGMRSLLPHPGLAPVGERGEPRVGQTTSAPQLIAHSSLSRFLTPEVFLGVPMTASSLSNWA